MQIIVFYFPNCQRRCNAQIIISDGSGQIYKDMAEDCAEINERDVLFINSQHNKNYMPLYDLSDVEKSVNYMTEFSVNRKNQIR